MQKLIKINTDHYIIVDESKRPVEGYYSDSFINKNKNTNGAEYGKAKHCCQITYSTHPLELLTLSENGLSGMGFSKVKPLNIFNVKELIGEVDVEKKAKDFANNSSMCDYEDGINVGKYQGYVEGYNQALEDNKDKKYTEEDLRKAMKYASEITNSKMKYMEEYIQSLQPKTEWEVEIIDGQLKLK